MGMDHVESEGRGPGASWIARRARRARRSVAGDAARRSLTVTAALALALGAGAAVGPAAHASVPAAPHQAAEPAAPRQAAEKAYLVRADAGHLPAVLRELRASHLTVTRTLGVVDEAVVRVPAGTAARLAGWPHVAEVTPDGSVSVESDSYDQTSDPNSAYSIADSLNVDAGWAKGATGKGVTVALIDTGVTPVNSLAGTTIINGPDLSFDSQNDNTRYLDLNGHGTFMAGLIAADPASGDPTSDYQGMAPAARLVNVKVGDALGRADVSQVIAGIDWVVEHKSDLNIRVLNLSFGTDSTQSYQLDPLAHAAEVAWRKGIVVVASAGNGGGTKLTMPAADPYLIAVGALNGHTKGSAAADVLASFSAQGGSRRKVDLDVPGVHVQGIRVPGSYVSDQLGPNGGINDQYIRGSGTSESAAIVSGMVADLLSARPGLTPNQVKAILVGTGGNVLNTQGVVPDLAAALAAPAPSSWSSAQWFTRSTGTGSIEASRGSYHVSDGTSTLSGEQDIFGNPIDTSALSNAEEQVNAWQGGVWNGASWAGASWAGASWASVTWSGNDWAGASWAGASWAGASWAGASWTGASWAGASWAGASWAGASWAGAGWASEDYS
ncbi:MAG TPA: S8 family serine peptidase [Actinomycetes bacterium]|nr:S8 family serine peptidase [Actinomycetes bacterium]